MTAGEFTGTAWLVTSGVTAPRAVPLSLTLTSWYLRILGGALIAAGLALAWLINVYARRQAVRLDALVPVARLAERIEAVMRSINAEQRGSVPPLVRTLSRLADHKAMLRPAALEAAGLLPSETPNAFGQGKDTSAALQTLLATVAAETMAIAVVVREGWLTLVLLLKRAPTDVQEEYSRALDAVGATVTDTAFALQQAHTVVATARQRLEPQHEAAVAGAGERSVSLGGERGDATPTLLEIQSSQARLSWMGWTMWALVTWLAGLAALIASNPGFGTPQDLWTCFFWGAGVQLANQQLQQLSPASFQSWFSIPLPGRT